MRPGLCSDTENGLNYETIIKIIDNDTISYREKVSSGSYTVNIFARF